MKKLLFFLTILCPNFIIGQADQFECYVEDNTTFTNDPLTDRSFFGDQLTPKGNFKALLVYATFTGYEPGHQSVNGWNDASNEQANFPDYVEVLSGHPAKTSPLIFNSIGDFSDPTILSNNDNLRSVSNSFNICSKPNEDFKLYAEVFEDDAGNPTVISVDTSLGLANWNAVHRTVLNQMVNLNQDQTYWDSFDNRNNGPAFHADLSANNNPDGVIDLVIIIYRFRKWSTPPFPGMNGWNGSGGGGSSWNLDTSPITYMGLQVNEGLFVTRGEIPREVLFHELGHAILDAPHVCGTNGVIGNYFYRPTTGLGSTAFPGVFHPMLNAWERWYLGYNNPTEVNSSGIFVVNDYLSTGDALRIEIPFSGGQSLWIENHTGVESALEEHQWDGDGIGPNLVQYGSSDLGLYMYVENIGPSNQDVTLFNAGANGIRMLNASGNYDFFTNPSAPVVQNNWGHFLSRYYEGLENPVSGINPWYYERKDVDLDGSIGNITSPNSANLGNEGEQIVREFVSGVDNFSYRNVGVGTIAGGQRSPVFQAGDILSMGTNPTILNHPELLNNHLLPFVLNGLRVEVVSVDPISGAATISVNYGFTQIENDVRWSGNIELPNIRESNPTYDLILGENKTIELNQGHMATQPGLDPISGEYVPPTFFRVLDGATVKLLSGSKLLVNENSTLRLEEEVTLIVEEGATVEISENSFLQLATTNIILKGPNSVLDIKGRVTTDENVNLTFSGDGYIRFHPTSSVGLGNNGDLVLEGGATGPHVMELMGQTSLSLNYGAGIELNNANVSYHDESEISVAGGKIYIVNSNLAGTILEMGDIAIRGYQPSSVYISKSFVSFFETGVEILEADSESAPVISQTSFTNCDNSLVCSDMDWIGLYSNTFENNVISSIDLTNILEVSAISNQILSTLLDGVIAQDVGMLFFKSGFISNCVNGIESFNSNIFLTDGFTISDCSSHGFYAVNDFADKVLSMGRCQCAAIINNEIGIGGENLVLDIDGYVHQALCKIASPLPNRFDGNVEIFDLCYSDPSFDSSVPILMRYNFWGGLDLFNYTYSITAGTGVCPSNPGSAVSVNSSDFISSTSELPNCSIAPAPYPNDELSAVLQGKVSCLTTIKGQQEELNDIATVGWKNIVDSNLLQAYYDYQPIANLRQDTTSYSKECTQKIDFAYCIYNTLLEHDIENRSLEWRPIKEHQNPPQYQLSFKPNPSQGMFQVLGLEEGLGGILLVYDLSGKLIYSQKGKSNFVDLSGAESGFYFVKYFSAQSGYQASGRLIIED